MIYRIKFIYEELDGFAREIKIDSDASFLDLHRLILQACDYSEDQMTCFYVCDDHWRPVHQVTREDFSTNSDDEVYLMSDTYLADLIEGEGQKMEFVFDPFSDRRFSLEVKEEIPGENLVEGVVSRRRGDAPQQIADLDLSDEALLRGAQVPLTASDEEEGYDPYGIGGDTFNSDELDVEGYEVSDSF